MLKATRPGGRISVIGVLSVLTGEMSLGPVLHHMLHLDGIYVVSRAMFADLNRALVQHGIVPTIDRVFDFADSPAALRYFQQGVHFGKVAIRFPAAE